MLVFLNISKEEVPYQDIEQVRDSYISFDLDKLLSYNDLTSQLSKYTKKGYLSSENPNQYIAEIREIYRKVGVPPLPVLTDLEVEQEIQDCLDFQPDFLGPYLKQDTNFGTNLCKFYFPNIYNTPSALDLKKSDPNVQTLIRRYYTDKYLDKAIRFVLDSGRSPLPPYVFSGLRVAGSSPFNFYPMAAQALYERFCPQGGVIFDTSSGFGGRLLGALTSTKGYTYVGTDPSMESIYNAHRLGTLVNQYLQQPSNFELHCVGSEVDDLMTRESWADLHFTSPPYFNLEDYDREGTNREAQSHIRYPNLDAWLDRYVRGTCRNIAKALKPNAYSLVNLTDFKVSRTVFVPFVEEWKRIAEEEGLEYFMTVFLHNQPSVGSIEKELNINKEEPILVFRSKKPVGYKD